MERDEASLSIGLVGCGYWGSKHLRLLSQHRGCALKWVCDSDVNVLVQAQESCPSAVVGSSLDRLLDEHPVEAVVIATPLHMHQEQVAKCLEAGCHVLCEKPLVETEAQAVGLGMLAEKKGVTLMVGHIFEYNDAVRHIRNCLTDTADERLLYLSSKRTGWGPVRTDTGIIYDLACHDVSIMLHLTGEMPLDVRAIGRSFFGRQTDLVQMTLNFPNDVVSHIMVSWLSPLKQRVLEAVTSKRMIVLDDVALADRLKEIAWNPMAVTEGTDFASFQMNVKAGDIIIPSIDYREPLKVQFEHFLDCISTGQTPLTDAGNASRVCRVLEALQRSLEYDGAKVGLA